MGTGVGAQILLGLKADEGLWYGQRSLGLQEERSLYL